MPGMHHFPIESNRRRPHGGVLALAGDPGRVRGLVVGGTFGWPLRECPTVSRMIRLISGPVPRALQRLRFPNSF